MSSRASAGKELGGTSDSHRSGTELVCPLFLPVLSVAETGSVVTECCGKRRSYVHYSVLFGLRKNMKSQGSHFPDQVSKLTPLEYKSETLALKETCSGPWLMNAEHQ